MYPDHTGVSQSLVGKAGLSGSRDVESEGEPKILVKVSLTLNKWKVTKD